RFDIDDDRRLQINEIIVGISKESMSFKRSLHCAAGSEREMNLGLTSLAAPHAASSSVSRYSCTERRVAARAGQSTASEPGTERCLLASAAIRVASTAKPSPPTRPSSMLTTVSKTCRKASL